MVASGLPGWTWVNMAPFFSAAEFLCNGVTKKAWILSWQFHANCNMFHIHLESWKWSKILISSSYRYILFTWVFWDHQLSSLFVGFKLWINTPRWLPWRSTQAEELMGPDGLIPQMQQPKRKARNAMFLAVLVAILPVPWNRDVFSITNEEVCFEKRHFCSFAMEKYHIFKLKVPNTIIAAHHRCEMFFCNLARLCKWWCSLQRFSLPWCTCLEIRRDHRYVHWACWSLQGHWFGFRWYTAATWKWS